MAVNQLRSKLGYLHIKDTLFVLCDLQEKFHRMQNYAKVVSNTQRLLQAGKSLGIDLIVTEQCPDKLGKTAADLDVSHAIDVIAKVDFSLAAPNATIWSSLDARQNISNIVLFGLETHICIEQSAMDFINRSFAVHIVADCTMSRTDEDRRLAFERMRDMGCIISSTENVIFKLLAGKNHPKFDEIRKLFLTTGFIWIKLHDFPFSCFSNKRFCVSSIRIIRIILYHLFACSPQSL